MWCPTAWKAAVTREIACPAGDLTIANRDASDVRRKRVEGAAPEGGPVRSAWGRDARHQRRDHRRSPDGSDRSVRAVALATSSVPWAGDCGEGAESRPHRFTGPRQPGPGAVPMLLCGPLG